MLKFNTATQPHTINAEVVTDSDGDLALRLDGITVLYINAASGRYSLSLLTPCEADRLKRRNLDINTNGYLTEE